MTEDSAYVCMKMLNGNMKKIPCLIVPLLLALQGARADNVAQAIWCDGNKTLYFDYCASVDNTYNGQDVKAVYQVTDYDVDSFPFWNNPQGDTQSRAATTVIFQEAFKDYSPTTCKSWFEGFESLTSVDGLQYLKTGNVTNMDFMFKGCSNLTTIDVTGFDVSKVTTAESMFLNCSKLTTIYCNKDWTQNSNIKGEKGTSMFEECTELKGAVSYSEKYSEDGYQSEYANGQLATPRGYFTPTLTLTLSDNADNTETLTNWMAAHPDEYAIITLSGRTLYRDSYWNTLCLPFDVDSGVGALKEAYIQELNDDYTSLDKGTLTLVFTINDDTITAGTPFIIRWKDVDRTWEGDISNPTFHGLISRKAASTVTTSDGKVNFVGQFSPFQINESNWYDILYIGSENHIGYSASERTLRSFRAHFYVGSVNGQQMARSIVFIDDDQTTGITTLPTLRQEPVGEGQQCSWFTLDGRRLSGKPSAAGTYILSVGDAKQQKTTNRVIIIR